MEIKNCPFCNGTADVVEQTDHDSNGNPYSYVCVTCDDCCACSQRYGYSVTEDYGDPVDPAEYEYCKKNVIEEWNKRA